MSELDERLGFTTTNDKRYGLIFSFELDKELQSCSTVITIPVFYDGWKGVAHGGITATLLDEAMAYACYAAGCADVATIELSTKFIRPVPTGKELFLQAEVIKVLGRVFHLKAKLLLGEQLLAQAFGKMYRISERWKKEQAHENDAL